tara:strand:- start:460 stop:645 length:186 start_codon:yes stop_codon:yes gene_type:complete
MTRKDYEKIAKILNSSRYPKPSNTEEWELNATFILQEFINMFAEDNPKFNARRFRNAVYGR